MQLGTHIKKVPGGKLLRIDARFGLAVEELSITGDFFLHPEETIRALEQHFIGKNPDHFKKRGQVIARELDAILKKNAAQLIGISTDDVVDAVREATR